MKSRTMSVINIFSQLHTLKLCVHVRKYVVRSHVRMWRTQGMMRICIPSNLPDEDYQKSSCFPKRKFSLVVSQSTLS